MRRASKRLSYRLVLFISLFTITLCCFTANATAQVTGEWHGELIHNGYTWPVWLHIDRDDSGYEICYSLPGWGMFLLPTSEQIIADNRLSFDTQWLTGSFSGSMSDSFLSGTWQLWDRDMTARLYRVSDNARIPRSEEITLELPDGGVLAGTLLLPDGDPPYAGMVFTHGSGPDTRTTGPYVGKANLAVMSGLAVMVYDKRGAGKSTGDGAYRTERLTADALAMWRQLRDDDRIDPERVGIGGISQGGYVAPRAAFAEPDVAFVFTVSAPALSSSELNIFAMENRLIREHGTATADGAVEALRMVYRYYDTGVEAFRDSAVALIEQGDPSWTESPHFKRMLFSGDGSIPTDINVRDWDLMFSEPLKFWMEVEVPVLGIWGADDINVPATLSRDAIEAALQFAGNDNYRLIVYPDAGHGISLEDLPEEDFPRAAPGYVETMRRWFEYRATR